MKLPTDLWTEGGVSELNLMQLEGQARAATRALVKATRRQRTIFGVPWLAAFPRHTTPHGRIEPAGNSGSPRICWNDQTLAQYHAEGLKRPRRTGTREGTDWRAVGPFATRFRTW